MNPTVLIFIIVTLGFGAMCWQMGYATAVGGWMNDKRTMLDYLGQRHFDALKAEAESMHFYGISGKEMTLDELKVTIGYLAKNSPLYLGVDLGKEH